MMDSKGISFVELIVVISIIGILAGALGHSYQDWAQRYAVEAATRLIYSDLQKARISAVDKNCTHFAVLNDFSYEISEDSNGSGTIDSGDSVWPAFPKQSEYRIVKNGSGNKIYFHQDGQLAPSRTIRLESDCDPDRNCIKISSTRIVMGKYLGGACQPL